MRLFIYYTRFLFAVFIFVGAGVGSLPAQVKGGVASGTRTAQLPFSAERSRAIMPLESCDDIDFFAVDLLKDSSQNRE